MVELIIGLIVFIGAVLLGFSAGYRIRDRDYQELLENYKTFIDRDPKTGRFVKSMRTLKHD